MRRHNAIVLGLIGLTLPASAFAQSRASISKDEIIKAMSDEMPLPAGTREKAFSLGSPSTRSAAPATQRAVRPTQRYVPAATSSVNRGTRRVRPAVAAYAPTLDMRVAFENGSAVLTEQAKAEARVFADAMKSPELANKRFTVAGHTDAIGSRAYNIDLSRRRAQAVVDFLSAQGADRSRLVPSGYGFDHPRSGLTARDPGNRRVEFARAS